MTHYFAFFLALACMHGAAHVTTVEGNVAKELYQLINTAPNKMTSSQPIRVKALTKNFQCSERISVSDVDAHETRDYRCTLPAQFQQNSLRVDEEHAKLLFDALATKKAITSDEALHTIIVHKRQRGAISCSEISLLGTNSTHSCIIARYAKTR